MAIGLLRINSILIATLRDASQVQLYLDSFIQPVSMTLIQTPTANVKSLMDHVSAGFKLMYSAGQPNHAPCLKRNSSWQTEYEDRWDMVALPGT